LIISIENNEPSHFSIGFKENPRQDKEKSNSFQGKIHLTCSKKRILS
jgi:hypothetical protein